MINSLTFGGEKLFNISVEDACEIDTELCYVLAFCGCKRELKPYVDPLTLISGYNPDVNQVLSHDDHGNLFRDNVLREPQ